MFFSKLSVVVASVLIAVAAARPSGYGSAPPPVTPPSSNQCCTSVQSSSSSAVSAVGALLGLDLSGLDVPIGLGCSPITVIGNNCGGTTVTCDAPEKSFGSLIAINCIPITL
ncbi:fungal hydrophobin [Mycena polygramma]|nr:fungal hydrophobin [Mycena polygramma]